MCLHFVLRTRQNCNETLRTAVIADNRLHIQAGGGVVLDSDPSYEYAETMHKSRALKRAAEMAAKYEGNS